MLLICEPMEPIVRTVKTSEFWWGFIVGAVLSGLIFRFVI